VRAGAAAACATLLAATIGPGALAPAAAETGAGADRDVDPEEIGDPYRVLPRDTETFRREGFAIGFGPGIGVFVGTGNQAEFRGAGGTTTLRVGTAAGPRLQWIVELDGGLYRVDADTNNHAATLTFGGQFFAREAFFLKGGIGAAHTWQSVTEEGAQSIENRRSGAALLGGAGLDVYRRRSFTVNFEVTVSLNRYRGGGVGHWSMGTMVNWY
jgi:hypothetical protein